MTTQHTYGAITIPESRTHAIAESTSYPYYAQKTDIEFFDDEYHLYIHEFGLSSFADVLGMWSAYTKRDSRTGVELYRADDSEIWSRPVIAP